MAGIEIPGDHNCGAWRSLCNALLSSNVAEVTRQAVMPEHVLNKVDDITSLLRNDALGRDDERRHQMARSIVEKLRCKRAHLMSLTKEVVQIGAVLTSLCQSYGHILTSTNNDLIDVSVSRQALCKDIKAADQPISRSAISVITIGILIARPSPRSTYDAGRSQSTGIRTAETDSISTDF